VRGGQEPESEAPARALPRGGKRKKSNRKKLRGVVGPIPKLTLG